MLSLAHRIATSSGFPTTLMEAVSHFRDEAVCREFIAEVCWPDGVRCIACRSDRVGIIRTRATWQCRDCRRQFSVRKGTIFEDSRLPLSKWLVALWVYTAGKKSRSSHQLARDVGVSQRTAWFMGHRLRLAMETEEADPRLSGEVEVDETFVGGKEKNKHEARRLHAGRGPVGKMAVMGLLSRHGPNGHSVVHAVPVTNRKKTTLQGVIQTSVARDSTIYSDALHSYDGLDAQYIHEVIDHSEAYVRGRISTNGIENFWSLFKRVIYGTHHSVTPVHLDRYLAEATFKFNTRSHRDNVRFIGTACRLVGRHLSYAALTARDGLGSGDPGLLPT